MSDEQLIPVAKLPERLPNRPHKATVWRWIHKGVWRQAQQPQAGRKAGFSSAKKTADPMHAMQGLSAEVPL